MWRRRRLEEFHVVRFHVKSLRLGGGIVYNFVVLKRKQNLFDILFHHPSLQTFFFCLSFSLRCYSTFPFDHLTEMYPNLLYPPSSLILYSPLLVIFSHVPARTFVCFSWHLFFSPSFSSFFTFTLWGSSLKCFLRWLWRFLLSLLSVFHFLLLLHLTVPSFFAYCFYSKSVPCTLHFDYLIFF